MRIDYKILPEKNLLIQQYSEGFDVEDYEHYIERVKKDPWWECVKYVLTDARGVESGIAYENLNHLVYLRTEVIQKKYFNVFLVDKPLATATVIAYKDIMGPKGFEYEFCSTLPHALLLLKLRNQQIEIEQILQGFSKNISLK